MPCLQLKAGGKLGPGRQPDPAMSATMSVFCVQLGVRRFLACARCKLWWMTPEWGNRAKDMPPETQFLLLELEEGAYAIMLPLIDSNTFRATLRPPR